MIRSFFCLYLLCLCFSVGVYANYAPIYNTEDITESLKDESIVNIAYSNKKYNNVGMIYTSSSPQEKTFKYSNGSVVYIGGGLCLTSAHLCLQNHFFYVRFEIDGNLTPYLEVLESIIHPNYAKNSFFDVSILVLGKRIKGLCGLEPYYDFSEKNEFFQDYQNLLVYVGYGAKLILNDWLKIQDETRRAVQAYTYFCFNMKNRNGIGSTPYKMFNNKKKGRNIILYEARPRVGMSGGAVIHPEYGLVSIIKGKGGHVSFLYDNLLFFMRCINYLLYTINIGCLPYIFLNDSRFEVDNSIISVPLFSIKGWIENIRKIHAIPEV